MTVAELIVALSALPQDAPVLASPSVADLEHWPNSPHPEYRGGVVVLW